MGSGGGKGEGIGSGSAAAFPGARGESKANPSQGWWSNGVGNFLFVQRILNGASSAWRFVRCGVAGLAGCSCQHADGADARCTRSMRRSPVCFFPAGSSQIKLLFVLTFIGKEGLTFIGKEAEKAEKKVGEGASLSLYIYLPYDGNGRNCRPSTTREANDSSRGLNKNSEEDQPKGSNVDCITLFPFPFFNIFQVFFLFSTRISGTREYQK